MKFVRLADSIEPGAIVRCTPKEFAALKARWLWTWLRKPGDGMTLDVIETTLLTSIHGGRQYERPEAHADDDPEERIETYVALYHLTDAERHAMGIVSHCPCFITPPGYRLANVDR